MLLDLQAVRIADSSESQWIDSEDVEAWLDCYRTGWRMDFIDKLTPPLSLAPAHKAAQSEY